MEEESNSSSLITYEEVINSEQSNRSQKQKKQKKGKIFNNFLKNDKDWNNIKIKEYTNENDNNNVINMRKSFKPSFTSALFNQSFNNINNNDSQNNEYNNKISKGEMTPSLNSNKLFFQSKFGKNSPLNETRKENSDMRKSCSLNFPITNNSSKNYYFILKEINKLIKYISNAQEIFSKKTIKINLNTNEKKFNLIIKSINKTKPNKNKKRYSNIQKPSKEKEKINPLEEEDQNILTNPDINDSLLENNEYQETEVNIMELIIEIFKKPSGIRNKDELFFIEHYLMTFENVMKILQQKKIGSAGNDLAKKIARYMQLDIIPKNTIICKLGDDGDKFYVIFQGSVAVLIPKETNAKMDINEYFAHLKKLFSLREYELALKTIESNLHIYKNKDIIYLKSDIEANLYIPDYFNYQRENLSIKDYIYRIEYNPNENNNENEESNNHKEKLNHNLELNLEDKMIFNFKDYDSKKHGNNMEEKTFLGKNIRPINFINKNPQKKSNSLRYNKLLELKGSHSISKDLKFNNEFNPLKKHESSIISLITSKNEDFDTKLNSNFGKSNKKNFFHKQSMNMIEDSKSRRPSFKTSKKSLFQDNNILETNNNNDENNDNAINRKNNVILWSYFHVTNLIDGQIFGDVALSEENKKRTATIITQENTICGTLDNHIYSKFIKDAQKKIRKNIVNVLLNVNFFKGINSEFFEEHYFNMFKYQSLQRNNYLFKSGDERNSLYIVISGEIEANIKCTMKKLNKILKLKNVSLDKAIIYENRLCILNEYFNHFYNNSQNYYKIKIHTFGSCIGMDDYIIKKSENEELNNNNFKDIFYVNTKCVSDKAELYSIDYKLLFNIFKTEKTEKNFHKIIKNSENQTLLRIIDIKKNAILERFENLCDKIFFENYNNIKNSSIEPKFYKGDFILKNFEKENGKRQKKFKILINDINSSFINNFNSKQILNKKASSLKNEKIKKLKINCIKSNSSSKTSKIIFEDIMDDFEKEKTIETDKNNFKNKLNTLNKIINQNDDKKSKDFEKSSYIEEIDKALTDTPLNFISKKNKNNKKPLVKLNRIKEIKFDQENISSQNKSKKNILNKYNKNIILYPILLKNTKEKIKQMLGFRKHKRISFKKNFSEEKVIRSNKKNLDKSKNSIFSLILNGLPHFNNKLINENIRENSKNCDSFKNAKLIDRNLLKIPKEKSFFYKGCESLLSMENNKNNNYIPIIDLLKYDELYEQKFGIKRNHSAGNKLSKELFKL